MQKPSTLKRLNKKWLLIGGLASILLLLTTTIAISLGAVHIPFLDVIKILLQEGLKLPLDIEVDQTNINIIMKIRLPRVILAGLIGASLALAGAAFQGLLRNPLADPFTLGISSGASVGAVAVIFLQITIPYIGGFTLPMISIIFSSMTLFAVLLFARLVEPTMKVETIILTGIISSSFLGAFLSLMIALSGEELRQIIGWLLGSVSMRGWEYIQLLLPFFVIGSILLLLNIRELNALSFGEERANYIGVNVKKRKYMILIAGSLLTGAAVAVSGTIGFVGLVIPHIIRLITGPNHMYVLPFSMIFGATFLIVADLIARTIIQPAELPVGVITALVGAPIFALILVGRRRRNV